MSTRSIQRLEQVIERLGDDQANHEDRLELRRIGMRQVLEAVANMTAAIRTEAGRNPRIHAVALEMADADNEPDLKANDSPMPMLMRELDEETTRIPLDRPDPPKHTVRHAGKPATRPDLRHEDEDEEEGELPEQTAANTAMMDIDDRPSAA